MIAAMSEKHKQVLRKKYSALLGCVIVSDRLLAELISALPNFRHTKDQINVSNSDLLFCGQLLCVKLE